MADRSMPLPLYAATISYRTPAGRRVLYGGVVAAVDEAECSVRLRLRLRKEEQYGRRRIAAVLDDLSARMFAMQAGGSRPPGSPLSYRTV